MLYVLAQVSLLLFANFKPQCHFKINSISEGGGSLYLTPVHMFQSMNLKKIKIMRVDELKTLQR